MARRNGGEVGLQARGSHWLRPVSVTRKLSKALRVLASLDRCWWRALCRGVAPSLEHLQVLRMMSAETVVDVGANRGQFSLVARHCFPQAKIVTFEPLAEPAKRFRSIFANDRAVILHQIAVGPKPGEAIIHLSRRDDSSSLLPITALQNRIFPGTQESGTETIKVGRLEEFVSAEEIEPPALLKLDVQGYELEALRGCESLLPRFAWVYCECSFVELYAGQALADEVIAWLRERGFILNGVYNMAHDRTGRAVQADFLFEQQAR